MVASLLSRLLECVKQIALDAGGKILSVSSRFQELKSDGSPLTAADLASNEAILSALSALDPRFPIISEESRPDPEKVTLCASGAYWLVDPLDGTKEFLKGNGEYTVNIALVENRVPILGVVYAPVPCLLYYAAQSQGSWKEEKSRPAVRLAANGTRAPITAVVSRSHPSPETDAFLARLNVVRTIERGSSLKMCAVAEGSADIYPRLNPTSLWDTAAGTVVAREAGCLVQDMKGNDLPYDCAASLLTSGFVVYSPKTCGKPVWILP